ADTAHARTKEGRRGRNLLLKGAASALGLTEHCRHRQGALGHQACDPRRGARAIWQARPRDSGARLPAPREELWRGGSFGRACPPVAEDNRRCVGGGGTRRTILG